MTRLILTVLALAASTAAARDFFVSPNGKDDASGKADAPFASVDRARRAARDLRMAEPDRKEPVVVTLRGGGHTLAATVSFGPEDSNTSYVAADGEAPVISGGVRLGRPTVKDGRWTWELPDVRAGGWNFVQLFINGERRYRPRLPKDSYFAIADRLEPSPKFAGKGFDRIKFHPGDVKASWANLRDVELLGFHQWGMTRFRIDAVDEQQNIVNFTGATRSTQPWTSLPKGRRYLVENVKEALSEPGEWYLDRPAGLLTYIPKPGEDPATADVIAPRVEQFLKITGDVPNKRWVTNLNFRGLTFAHANWVTPPEGNSYPQAEVNVPASIIADGLRDSSFENCTVRNTGNYAIDLAAGCKNVRIEGCTLTDLGAGGIKIGILKNEPDDDKRTSHNAVRNNLIASGGRLHPAAIGVFIGQSPHNVIDHNTITDLYYTGVSIGWVWGYAKSDAHSNVISHNHIHNLGQARLSDMGGIYTLGYHKGTVLHHNLIHDVDAFDYGGWGIYYDEGTTEIVAEHNVIYNTKTGGFHQHYGKDNVFRNNVIAFSRMDQVQRTRPEAHVSFTFERNIVYFRQGKLLGSNWKDDKFKIDRNLYWREGGQPFDLAGNTLEKWRARGHDVNSIVADPQFVDPAKFDFRLKPGGPAEKIGFQPIDLAGVGAKLNADLKPAPPAFPKPSLEKK